MFGTKEINQYFKKSIIIVFICPNLSFKSFKLFPNFYISEMKDFTFQSGRTTFPLQKLLPLEEYHISIKKSKYNTHFLKYVGFDIFVPSRLISQGPLEYERIRLYHMSLGSIKRKPPSGSI